MHEFVLSRTQPAKHGVKTLDVAKRLLDFGVHAPTVYFPLIVEEALMIEPTETETLDRLDHFADAHGADRRARRARIPANCSTRRTPRPSSRLDEGRAARELRLRWAQPASQRLRAGAGRPPMSAGDAAVSAAGDGDRAAGTRRWSGRSTHGASARRVRWLAAAVALAVVPAGAVAGAIRGAVGGAVHGRGRRRCRPLSLPRSAAWTTQGVARRGALGWDRRRWSDLRRAVLRRAGLLVSPYARPHWLDADARLVLPFPPRPARALVRVDRAAICTRHGL